MKKSKLIGIIITIVVLLITGFGVYIYVDVVNKNALSISEKKWINNNSSKLISIAVPNDLPVFGEYGSGVFFDFTNSLKDDGLKINNNTISYNTEVTEYGFNITDDYDVKNYLVYKDHYVLVSKSQEIITTESNIPALHPGVLSRSLEKISTYYNQSSELFKTFDTYDKITAALNNNEIAYALVPLNEYKKEILKNNMNILYHISDLNRYYYFVFGDSNTLNSILTKKLKVWLDKNFNDSYNKNNYALFIDALGITSKDEDTLTNQDYRYGFNETSAYETLVNNSYGGITAEYLNRFAEFANIEFSYQRYNDSTELATAAINGDIDLYYNYYNLLTNYIDAGTLKPIEYYVIADNSVDLSMSNLNGLQHQTVYVMENSCLYDIIKDIEGINIITYQSTRDLPKVLDKKTIVILDDNIFEYYVHTVNNDYSVRYKGILKDKHYSFRYKNDTDTFYLLLNTYTKTIDPADMLRIGIKSYNEVSFKRSVVNYIIISIVGVCFIGILYLTFLHKKNKRIKIDTKVKKEDRVKYIDMLTSLKNRNYYNEKLNVWNKNTIYPQTCIVLDLNRVKELNDTLGHIEGDKQIQGVANILIRTQIDSSEIMRTDGNEFFIYLVGYSEKQVVSYMKKLVKEFKKLPYDYGVAMGFSMIEDNTKLVEDAFNEASIQMRENKEYFDDEDDKKD